MKQLLYLCVILLLTSFSPQKKNKVTEIGKPKHIIVIIGDGMGLSQASTTFILRGGSAPLERFTIVGLHKSWSSDSLITDSGAGATAFSTGYKTYNTAIGVRADTVAGPTLFELAKDKGYTTSLLVTSEITHATPASFVAHRSSRYLAEEIASDIADSRTDYLIGGGSKFFTDRRDGKDLLKKMNAAGYSVDTNMDDFLSFSGHPYIALTSRSHMPPAHDRGDFLPKAAQQLLQHLFSSPRNSITLIESSQIDFACHENDDDYLNAELTDFNELLDVVLKEVEKRDDVLVVVTADHETGGYAVTSGYLGGPVSSGFVSKHHTPSLIPVYAYGVGASLFSGIYDNTDIFSKIKGLLH